MGRDTSLQLRGVPTRLHQRLRRYTRRSGSSMSRFAIEILADDLSRPTIEEWLARVESRTPVVLPPGITAADLVHEARREEDVED